MAELVVPFREGSKTFWLGKACKLEGASREKDWQKGKKRNEYFILREHTNRSPVCEV